MKATIAVVVGVMACVIYVAHLQQAELAYRQGYKDGIQYARDLIKYEINKDRRAQCIEDAEAKGGIPEA